MDEPTRKATAHPSLRLIRTPGHSPEDITLVAGTDAGVVAFAGDLWWNENGPTEDPVAPDREAHRTSRNRVLDVPDLIVPGESARAGGADRRHRNLLDPFGVTAELIITVAAFSVWGALSGLSRRACDDCGAGVLTRRDVLMLGGIGALGLLVGCVPIRPQDDDALIPPTGFGGRALPIPPLLAPDADGRYTLRAQAGETELVAGVLTATWNSTARCSDRRSERREESTCGCASRTTLTRRPPCTGMGCYSIARCSGWELPAIADVRKRRFRAITVHPLAVVDYSNCVNPANRPSFDTCRNDRGVLIECIPNEFAYSDRRRFDVPLKQALPSRDMEAYHVPIVA